MSRGAALAFLSCSVLLALEAGDAAARLEPVEVTVSAPAIVASQQRFEVRARAEAESGAFDIAARPLRLRVRLAPECGGSFAGTEGPTVIDRTLPEPTPGAAYDFSAGGTISVGPFGRESICAYVEDAQERQFATSTEEGVVVSRACTEASKRVERLRRKRAHAHGRHRRRALTHRLRRARHTMAAACESAKPG